MYCLEHVKNLPVFQTNGLKNTLNLKIGGRYMITQNLDVNDGLCNGVLGILKHITWGYTASNEKVPSKLFFLFEDIDIGVSRRKKCQKYMVDNHIDMCLTPIERVSEIIYSSKNSATYVVRSMFPISPAMGITVHKSQGITVKNVVVHSSKCMSKRHYYVAMSRVTSENGLYIDGTFKPPPITTSVTDEEMERLRINCKMKFKLQIPENVDGNSHRFIYHNCRSYRKHHKIFLKDKAFANSACIMLVETWLLDTDVVSIENFTTIYRRNCEGMKRHAFGSLLLANGCLNVKLFDCHVYVDSSCFLETVAYVYEDVVVVFLHRSPRYKFEHLLLYLELIFNKCKVENILKIVVIGDFNVDFLSKSYEHLTLKNFMLHHGFLLCQKYFPTTDYGSMIDLCFSNIPNLLCEGYESITSDH
jgi:hypothetical protein